MTLRPSLRETFEVAFGVALAFSAFVCVIGIVAAVIGLFVEGWHSLLAVAPAGLGGGIAIMFSYFAAAAIAAPAYYLLSPIAHRWFGKVLIAGVLGFIIYGTVGLTLVLAYVYFDINIIDFESVEEAWQLLLPFSLTAAGMTAVLGSIIWQLQRR